MTRRQWKSHTLSLARTKRVCSKTVDTEMASSPQTSRRASAFTRSLSKRWAYLDGNNVEAVVKEHGTTWR